MTPGRPDARIVDRHLIALRKALGVQRQDAEVSAATLGANPSQRWAVERGLQLCAQNALNIAGHISSALGLDPDSYGSAIDCLVEADVLPKSFGDRFRGIAGFRNVLVHGYLDVDLDLVVRMLTERLDDFEEFVGHVEHWLAAQPEP